MESAEEYDFEKLSREIVLSRLKDDPQAPQAAGEIARQMIVAGVQSTKVRQDPHLTVSAACRGVMSGMLLMEKDLPRTAVEILKQMPSISHEVPIDTGDLMTWCIEGIAAVSALAGLPMQSSVQEAIEESFMGAGEVFRSACSKGSSRGG